MCAEEAAADGKALREELNRAGAFLPYISSHGDLSCPWLNDLAAPVCYNPQEMLHEYDFEWTHIGEKCIVLRVLVLVAAHGVRMILRLHTYCEKTTLG